MKNLSEKQRYVSPEEKEISDPLLISPKSLYVDIFSNFLRKKRTNFQNEKTLEDRLQYDTQVSFVNFD